MFLSGKLELASEKSIRVLLLSLSRSNTRKERRSLSPNYPQFLLSKLYLWRKKFVPAQKANRSLFHGKRLLGSYARPVGGRVVDQLMQQIALKDITFLIHYTLVWLSAF